MAATLWTFAPWCRRLVGRRMQARMSKRYLSIGNKTILEHSVHALLAHPQGDTRCYCYQPRRSSLCPTSAGESSANHRCWMAATNALIPFWPGYRPCKRRSGCLVHDAARPCLHQDDLARLLTISENSRVGGILAGPGARHHETRRTGKNAIAHTVEARRAARAHPAVFPRELLHDCLTRALNKARDHHRRSVSAGVLWFHPALVEGRADNIGRSPVRNLALAEFI